MRNKIVGIDFHSTLVNFNEPFWVAAEKKLKLKRDTLKAPIDFHLSCYHRKVQTTINNLFHDPNYMMDIKPSKFSQLLVRWLNNRDCKIRIISATAPNIRGRVEFYLMRNFELVDPEIIFVDIDESKKKHFSGLTYWIDDNPLECQVAYGMGLFTFMVSNEFTPWNHSFKHDYIKKVKSLYNVIEYFKGV